MPRFNFDTFFDSLITLFVVVIGDGWNFIFNSALASDTFVAAPPYFLIFFVMANCCAPRRRLCLHD